MTSDLQKISKLQFTVRSRPLGNPLQLFVLVNTDHLTEIVTCALPGTGCTMLWSRPSAPVLVPLRDPV